jgi:hypothetical protein
MKLHKDLIFSIYLILNYLNIPFPKPPKKHLILHIKILSKDNSYIFNYLSLGK